MAILPDDDPRMRSAREALGQGQSAQVDAEATVRVRNVYVVETQGAGCVFPAPALLIEGEVESMEGQFPGGYTRLAYPQPSTGDEAGQLMACPLPTVRFLHRFTTAEQAELVMRGLTQPGFEIPEIMRSNTYSMPVTVDVRQLDCGDGAITSVSIHDAGLIETSTAEDGYQFLQFFPVPETPANQVVREPEPEYAAVPDNALTFDVSAGQEAPAADQSDDLEAGSEAAAAAFGDDEAETTSEPEPKQATTGHDHDVVSDVFARVVLGRGDSSANVPEQARRKALADEGGTAAPAQASEPEQPVPAPEREVQAPTPEAPAGDPHMVSLGVTGDEDTDEDSEPTRDEGASGSDLDLLALIGDDGDDDGEARAKADRKAATRQDTVRRQHKADDREEAIRRALADGVITPEEQGRINSL